MSRLFLSSNRGWKRPGRLPAAGGGGWGWGAAIGLVKQAAEPTLLPRLSGDECAQVVLCATQLDVVRETGRTQLTSAPRAPN
jgi:hypothetical protein